MFPNPGRPQSLSVPKAVVFPNLRRPQSLNVPISSTLQTFGAHLLCFRLTAAEGTRKKDLERLKASEDRGRAMVRQQDRDEDRAMWGWWWH